MKTLSFILFILLSLQSNSQKWVNDDSEDALFISHLRYSNFNDITIGVDSAYYIFTTHQPEDYWKKKVKEKSQLFVSRIDSSGNITYTKQLSSNSEKVYKALFNGKYYQLDRYATKINGDYFYKGFVYNSSWEPVRTFMIQHLKKLHQGGYPEFVVDEDENIYLFSSADYLDHRPQDFNGTFLIKCDKNGNIISKTFFDKSEISDIQIKNSILTISAISEKYDYPFYQSDSIIKVRLSLNLETIDTKKTNIDEAKIPDSKRKAVYLKNGDKVAVYDTTFTLSPASSQMISRLAYFDSGYNRKWGYDIPLFQNYFGPYPLKNGDFVIEKWKMGGNNSRYDTTELVLFNKQANQKVLFSYVNHAEPREKRRLISYYFQPAKKDIWVFYQTDEYKQDQRVYLKIIHIE